MGSGTKIYTTLNITPIFIKLLNSNIIFESKDSYVKQQKFNMFEIYLRSGELISESREMPTWSSPENTQVQSLSKCFSSCGMYFKTDWVWDILELFAINILVEIVKLQGWIIDENKIIIVMEHFFYGSCKRITVDIIKYYQLTLSWTFGLAAIIIYKLFTIIFAIIHHYYILVPKKINLIIKGNYRIFVRYF